MLMPSHISLCFSKVNLNFWEELFWFSLNNFVITDVRPSVTNLHDFSYFAGSQINLLRKEFKETSLSLFWARTSASCFVSPAGVWSSCTSQSLHCTSRFAYLRSCLSDMFEIVWFVWSVLEILNWSPLDWTLAAMSSSSPPHPQNMFEKPFNCLGTVQDGSNKDIRRVSKSPELVWSQGNSPPK